MIRLKAGTQYVIILLIFFISVYMGVKQSDILNTKVQVQKIDASEVENIFENSYNFKKIKIDFKTDEVNEKYRTITKLLNNSEVESIYSMKKNSYFVGLYQIPASDNTILNKLRSIGGMDAESVVQNNNLNKIINIESNLKNYRSSKEEIKKQMSSNTVSTNTKRELRKDLVEIQSKIDSLVYLPKLLENSKKSDLVYITVMHQINMGSISSKKIKKFIKIFTMILLIQILALVVLYFLMILITKLLNVLGVKTSRSKSSNYNNYNYYSRGKKKLKRVYKDDEDDEDKK